MAKRKSEVIAKLVATPEYQAQLKRIRDKNSAHRAAYRRDFEALRLELKQLGFEVESLGELRGSGLGQEPHFYKPAIPTLIEWLPKIPGDNRVLEDLVRCLAVKWAKPQAAMPLVDLFKNYPAPKSEARALRWAIGNSLEVVADDSVLDEMIELLVDREYGASRQMVAYWMRKMSKHRERVTDVLMSVIDDETVTRHVMGSLRTLNAVRSKPVFVPFLTSENSDLRKQAARAIEKFERIEEKKK